jgi:hypothetical protein
MIDIFLRYNAIDAIKCVIEVQQEESILEEDEVPMWLTISLRILGLQKNSIRLLQ